MTDKARNITIKGYLLSWKDELNAVFLYGLMAQHEENSKLAGIYRRLAGTEQRHADIWACRARTIANKIMSSPATAIDTLAREELGINPEDLGGSAHEAAIVSFLLFAAGAIVPVIPYMFTEGPAAVVSSALLSATGLFIIGAMTSFSRDGLFCVPAADRSFSVCARPPFHFWQVD